jgi:uncharacterized protein involved in exopolysaccharide biosynthesis
LALVLAVPGLVGAGGGFLTASSLPDHYAARSEIVLQLRGLSSDAVTRYLATQRVLVSGHDQLTTISASQNLSLQELEDNLSADTVAGSNVLRIQYADGDRDRALAVTKAITNSYLASLRELEIAEGTSHRVLTPAYLLPKPVWPDRLRMTVLGALAGLAVGLATLFLRFSLAHKA